jgi:O-antigen ligase
MTSVKTTKDLQIILTGFTVSYFLFMAHSYWANLQGRSTFSMGIARLGGVRGNEVISDPNFYGPALVCALPMLFPLLFLCKRFWHYLFVSGYALLAAYSVMLTGSRNAFLMLATLAVLPVLFSQHRFKWIPILVVALPVGWTVIPEDMKNRYRTIWDPSVERYEGMKGAGASMEGRFRGFDAAMGNWSKHPILGAGPGGHMAAAGTNLAAHNLPGNLAGELGTLGIVTFLFLLSCFGINHYNNWRNFKYLQEKNLGKEGLYCWRVSIATMYALTMLMMQGLGLNTAYFYLWVWVGAFQALATIILQEKVDAVIKEEPSPSSPAIRKA